MDLHRVVCAGWLLTGTDVLLEAIESAREGEVFSEFMLMTVASIGAFAIGEYPEAVAVMALYCIGEALQDHAVERARGNIKSLIAFRPDHAVVVNGSERVTVDPAQVKVGDTIEVKAGERVPIDGHLLDKAATFDTAALTGESVPRVIEAHGEVLAGMISNEGTVHIRASRPASESAFLPLSGSDSLGSGTAGHGRCGHHFRRAQLDQHAYHCDLRQRYGAG